MVSYESLYFPKFCEQQTFCRHKVRRGRAWKVLPSNALQNGNPMKKKSLKSSLFCKKKGQMLVSLDHTRISVHMQPDPAARSTMQWSKWLLRLILTGCLIDRNTKTPCSRGSAGDQSRRWLCVATTAHRFTSCHARRCAALRGCQPENRSEVLLTTPY